MTAAQTGYAMGMFFAAGGAGFIFLGLLKLLTIYRRWPRGSYLAASLFVVLLGLATASASPSTDEVILTMVVCLGAAVFIAWRGKLFSRPAAA